MDGHGNHRGVTLEAGWANVTLLGKPVGAGGRVGMGMKRTPPRGVLRLRGLAG
jgi:hypothetical protein